MARVSHGLADTRQQTIIAALHDLFCHRPSIWLNWPARIGQDAGVHAEYLAWRLAGWNRTDVPDDAENWKSMRAPHEGGYGQRSPRNYSGWVAWLSDPLLAGRRSQRVVLSGSVRLHEVQHG